jgi:hypothetical protein
MGNSFEGSKKIYQYSFRSLPLELQCYLHYILYIHLGKAPEWLNNDILTGWNRRSSFHFVIPQSAKVGRRDAPTFLFQTREGYRMTFMDDGRRSDDNSSKIRTGSVQHASRMLENVGYIPFHDISIINPAFIENDGHTVLSPNRNLRIFI